jgi:hypothetical protein
MAISTGSRDFREAITPIAADLDIVVLPARNN